MIFPFVESFMAHLLFQPIFKLSPFLQLPLGLVIGYLLATVSESIWHRLICHAEPQQRMFWKKQPLLFEPFSLSFFRHGVVHHCLTYRSDFVTKFENEEHKRRVIRIALQNGDCNISKAHCDYGLTISWVGFLNFNLTTFPFLPVIAMTLGLWSALSCFPMLIITPSLSRWIHPYLHASPDIIEKTAPRLVKLLLRTRYFRYVACHHFLHHKYQICNFNLLLGGDWLLGVHQNPSLADLQEMEALGFEVSELKAKFLQNIKIQQV